MSLEHRNQGGDSKPTGGSRFAIIRGPRPLNELHGRSPRRLWDRLLGRHPIDAPLDLRGTTGGASLMSPALFGQVYRLPEGVQRLERATVQRLLDLIHDGRGSIEELAREFGPHAFIHANYPLAFIAGQYGGTVWDLGLLSRKVVTTAGVNYLVDALQNLTEPENFKYHGYGTGTNAEASGDTGLQTELTTEYASDNTRPTGSQTEGASANIYRTVGTLSPDSGGTLAITEHGIFSASSAGTLLDRSKFSAINLVAGSDSLQTTYDLTLSAGG